MSTQFTRPVRGTHLCAPAIAALSVLLTIVPPADAGTRRSNNTTAKTTTSTAVVSMTSPIATSVPVTSVPAVTSSPIRPPIRVMMITSVDGNPALSAYPQLAAAAAARTKAVNATGGIGARMIELTVCNERYDPNVAADCARLAVSQKVDAVLATWEFFAGTILPILEPAGISVVGPTIGPQSQASAMASKVAFVTASFNYGATAGMVSALAADGCKRLAYIGEDRNAPIARQFAAASGMELVANVSQALATIDPAAAATAIAGRNPDCVAFQAPSDATLRGFVDTSERLGKTYHFAAGTLGFGRTATLSERGLAQVGASIDNMILVSAWAMNIDRSIGQLKEFRADIVASDPQYVDDDFAIVAWSDAKILFDAMAATKSDVRAETVLASLSVYTNPPDSLLGPFTTTKNTTSRSLPRLYNTNIWLRRVVNGRAQPTGSPTNVESLLRTL